MSDNLCGSSNGTKSLVAHVDRDRTLHQDRMVNGVSSSNCGASSFRSQQASSAAANGEFAAFHNGVPTLPLSPGISFTHQHVDVQSAFAGPSSNPSPVTKAHPFVTPGFVASSHPGFPGAANFNSSIAHSPSGIATNNSWVNQFTQMNLGQSYTPVADSTVTTTARSSFQSPYYNPRMPDTYMQYQFLAQTANQTSASAAQVGPVNAAEDAAFNQAFDAYDDGFQSSLDEWMAQNGPHADALIDQNMERIAHDQELRDRIGDPSLLPVDQEALNSQAARLEEEDAATKKRGEQEELADAAESILSAVAGNTSERFQNSRFLQIMRRIANYEVVAANNDLVDAETGRSVVTGRPEDEGKGKGKGKGKENDTGDIQELTQ